MDSENERNPQMESPRRVVVAQSQEFEGAVRRVSVAASQNVGNVGRGTQVTAATTAISETLSSLKESHSTDDEGYDPDLEQIEEEQLLIPEMVQNRDIQMSDATDNEGRSMNMSLQLELDEDMDLIPQRNMNDSDSIISEAFRDIDISRIDVPSPTGKVVSSQSTQSSSLSPIQIGNVEMEQEEEVDEHGKSSEYDQNSEVIDTQKSAVIERSEGLEEDEKAMELDDDDVVFPTVQRQQRMFSQTVSEQNENETVIQIHETPMSQDPKHTTPPRSEGSEIIDLSTIQKQKKIKRTTYSARKRKRKRIRNMEGTPKRPQNQQNQRNQDLLTPISRELVHRLNQSIISPTTRSRRKLNEKVLPIPTVPNTDSMLSQSVLSQNVQFEPQVIEQQQRRQQLMDRKRREQREQSQSKRGRSFSLMEHFRNQRDSMDHPQDDDGDDMEIVDDSEEERRIMVLNQSGLNREAEAIERERERTRKRRATRRKLADHAKRKRAEKKVDKYAVVPRPKMSAAVQRRYQQQEEKQADFWREIEREMKNNEFTENIKVVEDERDIRMKGWRSLTPPRIRKHLERRYTKQYENMTGEVVRDYGKKKGKRVRFLSEKREVFSTEQERKWEDEMNNSLITVTPQSSVSPVINPQENVDGQSGVGEVDAVALDIGPDVTDNISVDALSVPGDSRISSIVGMSDLSEIGTIEDDNESTLAVIQEDESGDGSHETDPFKNSKITTVSSMVSGSVEMEREVDDMGSVVSGVLPSIPEGDEEFLDSSVGESKNDGEDIEKQQRSERRKEEMMLDVQSVGTVEQLNDPFATNAS